MRAMGIIRRLDELGRVVIPVEMRRMLDLADRDMVEIAVDGEVYAAKAGSCCRSTRPAACSAAAVKRWSNITTGAYVRRACAS